MSQTKIELNRGGKKVLDHLKKRDDQEGTIEVRVKDDDA